MKSVLEIIREILKDTKNYKKIAWLFLIVIILIVIIYPILDANFLYYGRTNKRIEILNKLTEINVDTIEENKQLKMEYESIIEDMSTQKAKSLNNIFIKDNSKKIETIKFFAGAWMFIIVGFILPFTKDKGTRKRFSLNNIFAAIICFVFAGLLGWLCMEIPTIISVTVNVILYEIILVYLAYTIATAGIKNS